MRETMARRLDEIGCPLQRGGLGYDPTRYLSTMNPVCAIWDESDEPTEEELLVLKETVTRLADRAKFLKLEPGQEFYYRGVDTVTFYKLAGLWTYRRLFWLGDPKWRAGWHSLEDSVEDI